MGRPASGALHGHGRQGRGSPRRDRPRSDSARLERFALAALAAVAFGVLAILTACHDPAKDAAARDARDHDKLASLVAADEALDRAFKAADDVSRAGDDTKGAALLDGAATQAANEAVAECAHVALETPWADARRRALLAVVEERRASIPSYAEAMRGGDLDAKLLTITLQIDLQKRAMEAATAALAPAGGDAG